MKALLAACGVLALLVTWGWLALGQHPAILPGPWPTVVALTELLFQPEFWQQILWPSLIRMAAGIGLAAVLGVTLGLLAGTSALLAALMAPLRFLLSGLPAAVLVILLILWSGSGGLTIVLACGVLLAPLFYVAAVDGMAGQDRNLAEMALVYRLPWHARFRVVVWPPLQLTLRPALRTGITNGARLIVLAEILSGAGGLGGAIGDARTYLATDRLFALSIVVIMLILSLELALQRMLGRAAP